MLNDKAEGAGALAYRMEIRLAVVLRLRSLLGHVAGRVYLRTRGSAAERAAYQALRACEDLALPPAKTPALHPGVVAGASVEGGRAGAAQAAQAVAKTATKEPAAEAEPARPAQAFPALADDLRAADEVLPSWLGIRFARVPLATRARLDLGRNEGPSFVSAVFPGSPAETAGIEPGDILIGPPGAPFVEPNQVRSWTFLSPLGQPQPMVLVRGTERRVVTIVPKPLPMELPELPGPLKAGAAAPPLKLTAYRGTLPPGLPRGGPHLLYFWATWCGPCKAALPEVMAYAQQRRTPVIAITDETAETLNAFFATWQKPFPDVVAIDEARAAFLSYGVSGFPTFVLIDSAGKVVSQRTGYAAGLGIPGWQYSQ
jgi:thiol-disulfide isomerase/thioredoxin